MTQWINCSDEQPQTRRYVLVWNKLHEEIQIGEYVPDMQYWRGTYGMDDDHDITHWMDLPPAPPKDPSHS